MLWVGFAVTGPGYLWAICPTVKPVEKNQGVAMSSDLDLTDML